MVLPPMEKITVIAHLIAYFHLQCQGNKWMTFWVATHSFLFKTYTYMCLSIIYVSVYILFNIIKLWSYHFWKASLNNWFPFRKHFNFFFVVFILFMASLAWVNAGISTYYCLRSVKHFDFIQAIPNYIDIVIHQSNNWLSKLYVREYIFAYHIQWKPLLHITI